MSVVELKEKNLSNNVFGERANKVCPDTGEL
jgi:hypothetical protein